MGDVPDRLVLGEQARVSGHVIRRIGLAGDGAFVVDGQPLDLEGARRAVAAPAKPARKQRSTMGETPKPPAKDPELLVEVKGVLRVRGFRFQYRTFEGGEAVVVTLDSRASDSHPLSGLGAAMAKLHGAGLHVELGAEDGSLVVAWTKKALEGPPPKR